MPTSRPPTEPARRRKAREWWLLIYKDGSGTVTGWSPDKLPGLPGQPCCTEHGRRYVLVREVPAKGKGRKR